MTSAPSPLALLEQRRIIVCVGGGGVGKTTTAAALALCAARSGRRALVLDDRSRAAAGGCARRGKPGQRASRHPERRPVAARCPGRRSPLGADARHEAHLRRPRGAVRREPGGARPDPAEPDLPARLRRAGGKRRVFGHGEGLRARRIRRVRSPDRRHAALAARPRFPGGAAASAGVPRQRDRPAAAAPRLRRGPLQLPHLPAWSPAGAAGHRAGVGRRIPGRRVGVPARLRGHGRWLSPARPAGQRAPDGTGDRLRAGGGPGGAVGRSRRGVPGAAAYVPRALRRRRAQPGPRLARERAIRPQPFPLLASKNEPSGSCPTPSATAWARGRTPVRGQRSRRPASTLRSFDATRR